MGKKLVPTIIACFILALFLLPYRWGQGQETPAQYFPETGHYLTEPFLSFFNTNGGRPAYGLPITESIKEDGHLIQYFQRARMECPPDARDPSQVRLSPLGELLGHRTPRADPVTSSLIRDGLCRYFPETGHNVCFGFLTSYLNQGGPDLFGLPISELALEQGMITQYFERARIEWHMDAPTDEAMRLGALGEEHFRATGLDPALLLPVEEASAPQPVSPPISMGDYVRVVDTEGAGLRFRTGAGLGYETIDMLEEGTTLRVVGGPETADGFTWWRLDHNGSLGWCASEWLQPAQAPDTQ